MKLLLIQPPIQDFYDTDIRLQPMGLAYLKAAVKKHCPGIEVIIKDYHQGYGRRTIPLPAELSYLKEYFPCHDLSPFSTFHHYYHFGADFDLIGSEVAGEKPDIVGISALFSPYYREVLACADKIKKRMDVPIIAGGSHVSAAPLSILQDSNVDFVIRGEGERPLVEWIKTFEHGSGWQKVPNLGFKKDGKMILNPLEENDHFNELPWPDLSDLPPDRYAFKRKPLCFIATSRGCPHGCSFCSVKTTFGRGFRQRPADDILSEIKERYEQGYRVFDFEDDNLSFDRDSARHMLKCLTGGFQPGTVHFTAMNGLSYLSLDKEMLGLMKQAGFTDLNIALVSASQRVMSELGRPHSLEKYNAVVEEAYLSGLNITSYQILGLPNETIDEMIDTLTILCRQPVLIGASIFYLTPGCELANQFPDPAESDYLKARSTAMAIETDQFGREDIYTLFIMARIVNFIKGIESFDQKITLHHALEILKKIDKRSSLGIDILKKLFQEQNLYAATRQGFKPLPRFKSSLFFKAWERIGFITTRKGNRVEI
ncbi:MAG: B12-binding domain-containing radical SAM protein [Deltaproteobacteria bacterium]|nr:B12-binding domain-containing radical SAM protein [Deltaproteobacteria bacterium]